MHITKCKKSIYKGCLQYHSNYDNLEKAKLIKIVKRSLFARDQREGRMDNQGTEDFQGSETIVYDTVMVDTCHYTFVKTHRMCNSKSEL